MDDQSLIIAVLGLLVASIPVYLVARAKLRKKYKFDLDYKNMLFASFLSPENPKQDKRFCLVVYVLRIVNSSEESNTLKEIRLSYRFKRKTFQDESCVVPTSMIPKADKPAIALSNGLANIILMGWDNIRPKLGKYETLQPHGVFSGSAVFLFAPQVNDVRLLKNIQLIVTDFHGTRLSYPIAIQEEWYKPLGDGFAVINKTFTVAKDDTIRWN
jgi:hypothetical protein